MSKHRIKIRLDSGEQVKAFVRDVGFDLYPEQWGLENKERTLRIAANSFLGVFYASTEWNGEIYLINFKDKGLNRIPHFIDRYKIH